ncbi:MAG: leucyl aminopeptidase [Chloroflexi bacterium]|nr:leucyl aminopeptidase [Chloroflexota bacterium]|tara:strand:- start:2538 stop:4034 length:1497 start_codon:yes stop_codon:yes gene_type:complete
MLNIKVIEGEIEKFQADVIVVNLFEGVKNPGGATGSVDTSLENIISELIEGGEFSGKLGENLLLHTYDKLPSKRVLVVGLGKSENFSPKVIRNVSAQTSRYLRGLKVKKIASIAHGVGIGGHEVEYCAEEIAQGLLVGLYRYDQFVKKSEVIIEEFTIVEKDSSKIPLLQKGINQGQAIAEGVIFARDLVNTPGNHMTPTILSERAQEMAEKNNLSMEILNENQCAEKSMGAYLSVSRGSFEEAKFIVIEYRGNPDKSEYNLAFIGKSVTFDTGGISLKPAADMSRMKSDMAGGASVLGAINAIALLKPKINILAILPATENMPGSKATKPGDIVISMNGKSIEVENTDAEGRLTLADAVSYVIERNVENIIDVATLTGAMHMALGNVRGGLFGNNQDLMELVIKASEQAGEKFWQMPMDEEYKDFNKSDVADIKNTGGRLAGAITAAHFIGEFAAEVPWVHMDIAGMAMTEKDSGYFTKGSTGFPVCTLVKLALSME